MQQFERCQKKVKRNNDFVPQNTERGTNKEYRSVQFILDSQDVHSKEKGIDKDVKVHNHIQECGRCKCQLSGFWGSDILGPVHFRDWGLGQPLSVRKSRFSFLFDFWGEVLEFW